MSKYDGRPHDEEELVLIQNKEIAGMPKDTQTEKLFLLQQDHDADDGFPDCEDLQLFVSPGDDKEHYQHDETTEQIRDYFLCKLAETEVKILGRGKDPNSISDAEGRVSRSLTTLPENPVVKGIGKVIGMVIEYKSHYY